MRHRITKKDIGRQCTVRDLAGLYSAVGYDYLWFMLIRLTPKDKCLIKFDDKVFEVKRSRILF